VTTTTGNLSRLSKIADMQDENDNRFTVDKIGSYRILAKEYKANTFPAPKKRGKKNGNQQDL